MADTDKVIGLLRCSQCGATTEVRLGDLPKLVKEGWPVCCHETMAFFTRADPPSAAPHGSHPL